MDPVELKGTEQTWRLRYPLKSLRWFERQTGVSFQAAMTAMGEEDFSLENIEWLVAAALYHENQAASLDDADELIEELGFQSVIEAVGEAINRSALVKGTKEQDGIADAKNGRTGTGTKSSAKQRASA